MHTVKYRRAVYTWLVLVVATCVSVAVADTRTSDTGNAVAATVLVIAFGKVWLVGRSFMALHRAPRTLQSAFAAWCLAVGGAVIGIVLFG